MISWHYLPLAVIQALPSIKKSFSLWDRKKKSPVYFCRTLRSDFPLVKSQQPPDRWDRGEETSQGIRDNNKDHPLSLNQLSRTREFLGELLVHLSTYLCALF